MRSALPFMLSVVVAFTSCEKESIKSPESTGPEAVEKLAQLKFTLKDLNSRQSDTDNEGYDEYNYLGFGYDVTGKYAHSTSVRNAVINTPSVVAENAGRFDALHVLQSSFKSIYATNAEDFTKWLAEGTPNIGYFKGNITHPFPDTDPQENQYIYGLYDSYIKYRRLTLYGRNSQLIPYLTADFQADSKSLEPAELVKKYGVQGCY